MTIFTIGYEGINLEKFIQTLKNNQISTLIDIREIPISRKKGFSKTALRTSLDENNIKYFHFRELGSPKLIRNEYKKTKDWNTFSYRYQIYLQEQTQSINQIKKLLKDNCCLLCFEADYEKCHRVFVARKLKEETPSINRIIHLSPLSTMNIVEEDSGDKSDQLSTIDIEIDALYP